MPQKTLEKIIDEKGGVGAPAAGLAGAAGSGCSAAVSNP
jgi:hypothetical protein